MIVYADRPRQADCGELVARVRHALEGLQAAELLDHEAGVDLLVAFGDLQTAVTDALSPDVDRETPLARSLRRTMLAIGRLVHATWLGDARAAERWRAASASAILAQKETLLPRRVQPRVPEGYVFYSLRPETYIAAAQRFCEELRPRRALCLGLRSIGASLSAVVAATLGASGCATRCYTLRPRGHPFARALALSAELERELREAARDAFVLIVDEGPGLSGSSFMGATRAIAALGVPDERIVLFPSWQPDPSRFVSEDARARWPRHGSYVASFESVWLESGRLARAFEAAELVDLSAGRWREWLCDDVVAPPAVHPQHERRKYLLAKQGAHGAERRLLKFEGLADYGASAFARAERLWQAGFAPRPYALRHGFLSMDLVPGRPLTPADASPRLLERIAEYVAFRAESDPGTEPVPYESLLQMMRENVGEGLGPEWAQALGRLDSSRAAVVSGRALAVDGRMLPHEWLAAGERYLKTDAVDHHDDHSFPGHQDIAWDVAGTTVEFDLDEAAESAFVALVRRRLADPLLESRLPFYRAAYLAYRLGYATLAAAGVDAPDQDRFSALRDRYAARLAAELTRARVAA